MKRFTHKTAIAVCLAAGLVAACAKAPTTELADARQALTAASSAEAPTYAPVEFEAARTAFEAAETEISTQAGKLAISRKYETAKQLITDASAKAEVAKVAAITGKAAATEEATAAFTTVTTSLASIDSMMANIKDCPKKPKGFDADMVAMQGTVDAFRGESSPIRTAIDDGDLSGATTRANALQEQLNTVTIDLRNAMDKIGCQEPAVVPAQSSI